MEYDQTQGLPRRASVPTTKEPGLGDGEASRLPVTCGVRPSSRIRGRFLGADDPRRTDGVTA